MFLISIAFSLSAEIIEVGHFREMSKYITPDTLIILDIDDTLIIPSQMLGSDRWFESRHAEHKRAGLPGALEKTIAEWTAVRYLTKMKAVEEETEQLVRGWQEQGIAVMALTIQGFPTAHHTQNQLKANGFDLTKTAPVSSNHVFESDSLGLHYRDGILFAGGRSKGKALSVLCKKGHYHPKKIVFIDDKEVPLREVEEFAKENEVEYFGLRYAYADKHKSEYRDDIAEIQFTHSTFRRLLSDEEAAELLR